MRKICLLLVVINLMNLEMKGQDPEFSQFYANPLHLNPAMTGLNVCPRLIMNYRYQWPGIHGTYESYSISYDQIISENIGVGISFLGDKAGKNILFTNSISGYFAYHQTLTSRLSLSWGFQGSYRNKYLDKSTLVFPDEIDPILGVMSGTTQENLSRIQPSNILDFSSGLMLYSKYFYAGISAHHLFEPNESLFVEYLFYQENIPFIWN